MQKLEKEYTMATAKDIIEKSDIIFFDFFETLVHRTVNEKDLIDIWAYKLAVEIKYVISAKDLVEHRYNSIQKIYKLGRKEEYSYNEIMKELYSSCHTQLLDMTYEEFFNLAKKIEIETEMSVQKVREDIVGLVTYAIKEGKQVGIISDYYFGKREIELFLDKKNIDLKLFSFIFVSSEFGQKKSSGNLYKNVISTVGKEHKYAMIGDNPVADIQMAEKNGFKSYRVSDISARKRSSLKKEITKLQKQYQRKAFANYAFGFYYFMEQIYINAIKFRFKKLVFLSREGYLLKEMFDIYQADKNVKIDTKYLYVSRLSTFLPSLKPLEEETFDVIFKQYGDISIAAFLKNLQFDDNVIEAISKKENIDKNEIVMDFKNSQQFYKIKNNSLFIQTYETCVSQEKAKLRKYIDQVVGNDNEIVLVDIGWKGTMQDNLYKLWDDNRTFIGLYYGVFNHSSNESNRNIKKGLVFDKYPKRTSNYYIWEFETHLIEQLLAAPHGSTIGYDYCVDGIKPKLLHTEDDVILYELVEPIQNDIIKLFSEIVNLFANRSENSNDYFKTISRIQLRSELVISNAMILFENSALSEKTNNFGWFSQIPLKLDNNRNDKLKKILRDLKSIHYQDGGLSLIKYLNYVSIKMNAREKYGWKKFIYRLFYLPEYLIMRR